MVPDRFEMLTWLAPLLGTCRLSRRSPLLGLPPGGVSSGDEHILDQLFYVVNPDIRTGLRGTFVPPLGSGQRELLAKPYRGDLEVGTKAVVLAITSRHAAWRVLHQ